MKKLMYVLLGILVLAGNCPAHAEWANLNFRFTGGEDNQVVGPNEAFETTKPANGPWTASYALGNRYANLAGTGIRVFSANTVNFEDFNLASGNAGTNSHICFKFHLSEPVQSFAWDIEANGRNIGPASRLIARYSTNGTDWTDAVVYPAGSDSTYDPAPVSVTLPAPAQDIYIGWFAEVPQGDVGWWNLGSTGKLVFGSTEMPPPAVPGKFALQGERVVPNSLFGTTTHVNDKFAFKLLADLNIHCVRIDLHYAGLEPARGQYNLSDDLWMLHSVNLGIEHGFDQLAVITRAPDWAVGPKDTFPNDESVASFEELMYQVALKYKGKIRYWQAMNEPDMAMWKDRFIVFLKAFYHGVKRADPENKVVLCGFAGPEPSNLQAVYRLGGKDYFDILASHAYTRPNAPETGGFFERIEAMHNVMTEFGDNKPLWITESGWNGVEPSMLTYLRAQFDGHRTYACAEEEQARYLARLYLIAATVPWIERLYFFHLHQESPYTGITDNVDAYMGLFTPWLEGQVRPKDAYFSVKTVIAMINEATYKERIETQADIWALVFQKDNEATIAIWSLNDGTKKTLKDPSCVQSVTSMVGTPVLLEKGELVLSGRPIYLKTSLDRLPQLKEQLQEACR